MRIQVFGSGCASCKRLLDNAREAARAIGPDIDVEYVTDLERIVAMGILRTPGLAIDGKVRSTGRVPDAKEIRRMVAEAKLGAGA